MKSKLKTSLFAIIFIIISCEKDDICIECEIGTPRIILSFYDKTNTISLDGLAEGVYFLIVENNYLKNIYKIHKTK